ncbi:MAG TPA: AI-2E family transporter, partial [Jiangellaceae bacterium]
MTATDPPRPAASASERAEAAGPVSAFAGTPSWLRVAGVNAWLALGVAGAAAIVLWALSYTSALVTPFLFAAVLAILFTPVVDWMTGRRVPRFLAALLVLLGLVVVAIVSTLAVVRGIAQVAPQIAEVISGAADEVSGWLASTGVDPSTAAETTSSTVRAGQTATHTLISGVFSGLGALSSILFMLFIGSVIFLFMLLYGARYQAWFVRHSGMSLRTVEPIVHDSASAIRGYFRGTTILAVTNAVPVGITAWLLGLPLVGAIALVTFITAYIPFFGAIVAGVFACLIALGSKGLATALIMLAVLLLVNNVLQNFFAPVAYGSSLKLDPLVVLLVTTGAGLVGGVALIVLAAPLTAIISR